MTHGGREGWLRAARVFAAVVVLAILGLAAPIPASAHCLLGLGDCETQQQRQTTTTSKACDAIGTTDRNTSNVAVAPRLGQRLLARRPDGRLPFGFNDSSYFQGDASLDESTRMHDRVGSTLLRLAVHWGAVERDRGVYRWGGYDRLYCAAVANGIAPVLIVFTTPRWAKDATSPCYRDYYDCRVPPARTNYPALRRFAELLAIRYPRAAAIEAWNEPNAADFWYRPNAPRYVEVLREIYTGVKNGNPAMPVLGGALANHQFGTDDGSISIYWFLKSMYVNGAASIMDAVSLHPYPVHALSDDREKFTPTVSGVRSIVQSYDGVGRRRLWFTELGAAAQTRDSAGSDGFTEAEQSALLSDIYGRAERMPDVDAIAYHTLIDPSYGAAYGWVKRRTLLGYLPKRVYCDFAARLGQQTDCMRPIR